MTPPACQLVSNIHIIAYVEELYEMEGVLNNYKLGDKDKLEVYTGVAKVRKDLKVLQNKFRMVQNGAKYSSSSKKNNIGAWSPEKEEMKRSKRLEARAKRKKEDKKLAQSIRDQYRPLLKQDIEAIKKFPEEIGSKRSKEQLMKMRREIFNRRVDIEMQKKKSE